MNVTQDTPMKAATIYTAGWFYGIGVGPGDSSLIPVAAVAAMREADVIYLPRAASATESVARQCVSGLDLPVARFREIDFPMELDRMALGSRYMALAQTIAGELHNGLNIAYLTLGDPSIYSTYSYLLAALRNIEPALRYRTIPGITSFAAAAAALSWPLGEGKERILILPCPDDPDMLKRDIETHDVVVLMKIGKRLPQVLDVLAKLDLLAHCAFAHRVGLNGACLYTNLRHLRPADTTGYLSTMLIRRQPRKLRSG